MVGHGDVVVQVCQVCLALSRLKARQQRQQRQKHSYDELTRAFVRIQASTTRLSTTDTQGDSELHKVVHKGTTETEPTVMTGYGRQENHLQKLHCLCALLQKLMARMVGNREKQRALYTDRPDPQLGTAPPTQLGKTVMNYFKCTQFTAAS